jgi:hypothetical protein
MSAFANSRTITKISAFMAGHPTPGCRYVIFTRSREPAFFRFAPGPSQGDAQS